MKVVFRTDASLQIGTGHVMRCLTLADVLRARGAECRFICREHPGNLNALIRQHGHEVYGLPVGSPEDGGTTHSDDVPAHAAWLGVDWDSDANQTQAAIDETMIDWLIVDHYALDSRWEATLRPHCRKLMVIDDLADRSHDCDLLLDQNLVADWQHRYQHKVPADCGLLLGPEYALLQPQYAELYDRVPPREGPIRRVLVYFGGADNDNLTGTTIAAFLSLKRSDIALDVVINPAGPHAAAIRRQSQGNTQISLHEVLPSLAPLMVKADLAIGAGGTTSWERCCLGLPSLVVTLADNQKPVAVELDRNKLIRWLGHKNEVTQAILTQAMKVAFDRSLAHECSIRCRQHVDGCGAVRVCSQIIFEYDATIQLLLLHHLRQ